MAADRRGVSEPEGLPLHLIEAHPVPDPRTDGTGAFRQGLPAPVRSGMILTRSDPAHLGWSIAPGLRAGGRRYVLELFPAQEPVAVLEALSCTKVLTTTTTWGTM